MKKFWEMIKTDKAIFAWCCFLAVLLIIKFAISWVTNLMFEEPNPDYIWATSLAVWFGVLGEIIPAFMVSVPEVTALVTINYFSGELFTYTTGIHFRFPWEQVKDGNYINLRLLEKKVENAESFPAGDGPELLVKWAIHFLPNPNKIPVYIGVALETIENGLMSVASSFLSSRIKAGQAEDLRGSQADLEGGLKSHFETYKVRDRDGREIDLEDLYGIKLLLAPIADIDYTESYQKARQTEIVANKLKHVASNVIKGTSTTMTDDTAWNNAMILNGQITKNVQQVEGEGMQAFAAFLMQMARGGK